VSFLNTYEKLLTHVITRRWLFLPAGLSPTWQAELCKAEHGLAPQSIWPSQARPWIFLFCNLSVCRPVPAIRLVPEPLGGTLNTCSLMLNWPCELLYRTHMLSSCHARMSLIRVSKSAMAVSLGRALKVVL
jgi:hypothetical protein